MSDIFMPGIPVTFTAKEIRDMEGLLIKYFGFDYSLIRLELESAIIRSENTLEYQETYMNTNKIDHFPDDFEIPFSIKNFAYLYQLRESYPFLNQNETLFEILAFVMNFIPRLKDWAFNIEMRGEDPMDYVIQKEQEEVVKYLLESKVPNNSKPHEIEVSIKYGQNRTLKIENWNNWLTDLLIRKYQCLADETVEPISKPNRAPQMHNFLVYNTYLLLKTLVDTDKQYPADFSKFLINFSSLCEIDLPDRQTEVIGMKEFLSHGNRQYDGEPIPFSRVR